MRPQSLLVTITKDGFSQSKQTFEWSILIMSILPQPAKLSEREMSLRIRLQLIQKVRTAFNETMDGMAVIYEDDFDNAYERLDLILQDIEQDIRKNAGMFLGLMGQLLIEETSEEFNS